MISIHRDEAGFPTGGWLLNETSSIQRVAELATKGVWSPIVWLGAYRHESNFSCAAWCVLDIDDGLPKETAAKMMQGVRFAIVPTKSDGIPKGQKGPCDRYRIIAPWVEPITNLDIYRFNMKVLAKKFQADEQAIDGARCWQKSKTVELVCDTGAALPVAYDVPDEETTSFKNERFKEYVNHHKKSRTLPSRVNDFLLGRISEGSRNKELFFTACVLFNMDYDFEKVLSIVEAIPGMDDVGIITTLKSAAKRCGVNT